MTKALKAQDLLVLLAMLSRRDAPGSYTELAAATGLVASAVHGSLNRAADARLVSAHDGWPTGLKSQLKGFLPRLTSACRRTHHLAYIWDGTRITSVQARSQMKEMNLVGKQKWRENKFAWYV